jgi:hypothetical protein
VTGFEAVLFDWRGTLVRTLPKAEWVRLGLPSQVLMVGDRAGYDGAAVELGIVTLLLPPLTSVRHHRLHLVEALLAHRA